MEDFHALEGLGFRVMKPVVFATSWGILLLLLTRPEKGRQPPSQRRSQCFWVMSLGHSLGHLLGHVLGLGFRAILLNLQERSPLIFISFDRAFIAVAIMAQGTRGRPVSLTGGRAGRRLGFS
eukprot:5639213-Amphidinium_carterae.1